MIYCVRYKMVCILDLYRVFKNKKKSGYFREKKKEIKLLI